MPPKKAAAKAGLRVTQTGLAKVDELSGRESPILQDYIDAVSEYVRESDGLSDSASKTAQIALSAGLGRVLRAELMARHPKMRPHAGEVDVAGALRTARADVSESHHLDGLRLAVEIKPINRAVGRALWNRFGDVRAFAVNIHLKFPFAVVGGVLAVPTWEWAKPSKKAGSIGADVAWAPASSELGVEATESTEGDDETEGEEPLAGGPGVASAPYKRDTRHLIERLVRRLQRTRRRESEADAPHLMEAVAVIFYDPDTNELVADLPPMGSGLRWDEFVTALSDTYDLRFE